MPITLNGDTGITTPSYGGADTAEYLVPVTAFKNRIINGGMVINQRGVVVTNPNPSYVTDRWNAVAYGSCTVEQSSTAPTGFTNSLLWTTTSASAPSAGQWAVMNQGIEGFNVADLGWGAAGAQTVTLSFWVRSNTTGTYSVGLGNGTITSNLPSTQTRSYVATYTINAANTWEQKTITVTGDTTGTWLKTNGLGLCVTFDCGSGTTYQTSTLNSWQSGAFWRATGSVGIANTSSGTLAITGVQLEVGTNATFFDARPYPTELALCQRYFYSTMFLNSANSTTAPTTNDVEIQGSRQQFADVAGYRTQIVNHPVVMRSDPSIVYYNPENGGVVNQWRFYNFNGATQDFSGNVAAYRGFLWFWAYTGVSVGTAGMSMMLYIHWQASSEL